MSKEVNLKREFGTQRLDVLLHRWGLRGHDLVLAVSGSVQLTHKQVQRARDGRRLTLNMMQKVTEALNVAIAQRVAPDTELYTYIHRDLFSYAKGYDPSWQDPNSALYPDHE